MTLSILIESVGGTSEVGSDGSTPAKVLKVAYLHDGSNTFGIEHPPVTNVHEL